ncbi:MAG: dihydrolipoamide acetyltransferase family protein [Steroidobacteraceae bacterium]|nr:dihydrolipoamide acetyltransferase family protein [Steroidobacteraceae bacterium]
MSHRIFAITMPKWGIEMQEGTITDWHAAPGATLGKGDPLLDVETEKIVNSVEAPIAGTLRRIVADKGATEKVGALIGVFAEADVTDAEIDAFVTGFQPADTSFEPDAGTSEAAVAAPSVPASTGPAPTPADSGSDGEARVSPIARRVAERLGVDVTKVKGTGRNGRVSKEDVEAYAAAHGLGGAAGTGAAPGAAATGAPAATGAAGPANEPARRKMTSMRATIARRLLESKQGIPHYRLAIDADLTALLAHRARLNAAGGTKVSVNDLLVRACALALVKHPTVNAQLHGDEVHEFPHADVCVAVATENGLTTPVVRAADTKTAAQVAAEVADLAERARTGKLVREEITGGTFTISNLGMFGVDRFDAIVNPPQVAILAVGAGADRVITKNGQPTVAKVATLTLSCDHRVVDGAVGAQFLATLRALLDAPEAL